MFEQLSLPGLGEARRDVVTTSPDGRLAISLRRSRNGVIVGRFEALGGNAHIDCWVVMSSPDQFKRCALADALAFAYPQTFVQLMGKFDDVYQEPCTGDAAAGAGPRA